MPESALERLRRKAGIPERVQSDATRVAPRPKKGPAPALPTVSALPDERTPEERDREQQRVLGRRELRRIQRYDEPLPATAALMRQADSPASVLQNKFDVERLRGEREAAARGIDVGANRRAFGMPEEEFPATGSTSISARPERGRQIDPLQELGRAAEARRAIPYAETSLEPTPSNLPGTRRRLDAIADRQERDARIEGELQGTGSVVSGNLRHGLSRFARMGTMGVIDPERGASRAKQEVLASGDQVTPEQLRVAGVLSPDARDPSLLGSENYGPGRMAAGLAGDFAGLAGPLMAEHALARRTAMALGRRTATAVSPNAIPGIARIAGAERGVRWGKALTTPSIPQNAGEFMLAGGATEGIAAGLEDRDVSDAVGQSALYNAIGGAAFGALPHVARAGAQGVRAASPGVAAAARVAGAEGKATRHGLGMYNRFDELQDEHRQTRWGMGTLAEREALDAAERAQPEQLMMPALQTPKGTFIGEGHHVATNEAMKAGAINFDTSFDDVQRGFETDKREFVSTKDAPSVVRRNPDQHYAHPDRIAGQMKNVRRAEEDAFESGDYVDPFRAELNSEIFANGSDQWVFPRGRAQHIGLGRDTLRPWATRRPLEAGEVPQPQSAIQRLKQAAGETFDEDVRAVDKAIFKGVRKGIDWSREIKPYAQNENVQAGAAALGAGIAGTAGAEDDDGIAALAPAIIAGTMTKGRALKPKANPIWRSRFAGHLEKMDFGVHKAEPASAWIKRITKGGDFSSKEYDWTIKDDLEAAAAEGRPLTKAEVLDMHERNKLDVQVKVLRHSTKYGGPSLSLVEPGGSEYREILLTVNPKRARTGIDPAVLAEAVQDRNRLVGFLQQDMPDEYRANLEAQLDKRIERLQGVKPYEERHWDGEPNVIGHLRIKTRKGPNGEKILAIEEIQSQYTQDAAKFGFSGSEKRKAIMAALDAEIEPVRKLRDDLRQKMFEADIRIVSAETPAAKKLAQKERAKIEQGWGEAASKLDDLTNKRYQADKHIPELPFNDNSEATMLALKQAIDIAAKEGHEKIVWTTGEQQARRYKEALMAVADEIRYDKQKKKLYAFMGGRPVDLPEGLGDVPESSLPATIGKDAAEQLLASKPKAWKGALVHRLSVPGIELKSKGMILYYDEKIPNLVARYAKQLGVQLEIDHTPLPDAARGTAKTINWYGDADELRYQAELERQDLGRTTFAQRVAETVARRMDVSGLTFEQAQAGLKQEQRDALAELLGGYAEIDNQVVPVNQGFAVTDELIEKVWNGQTLYTNPFLDPKLIRAALSGRTGRAAGLMAGGFAAGEIGRETENEKLEWTGNGVVALGVMHLIGVPTLKTIGREVGGAAKRKLELSPLGRKALNAVSYDILATPELRAARDELERGIAKAAARSAEFASRLKELGPVQNEAVSDLIDKENWSVLKRLLTPEDWSRVMAAAIQLQDELTLVGKAQMDAGVFGPQVLSGRRNNIPGQTLTRKGRPYNKRVYAEWEGARATGGAPSGPMPTRKPGRLDQKPRDEGLQQHERARLGQVREAYFSGSRAIEQGWRNVASAKFLSAVNAMPGAVHPDYAKGLASLQAAILSGNKNHIRAAEQTLSTLTQQAGVFHAKGALAGYRALPLSQSLGALSGAVVRADVYDYLQGMPDMFASGAVGKFNEAYQLWKRAHTVWNPGTHIGNFLSNISVLHMKGIPWPKLILGRGPFSLHAAYQDIKAYGPLTRALAEGGVLNRNIASSTGAEGALGASTSRRSLQELAEFTRRPGTKHSLKQFGIEPPSKGMKRLRAFNDRAGDLYNFEDNIFRVALMRKATTPVRRGGLGLNTKQGVEYVREHMGDFRTRSPLLQMATYVSPFIMYPAKMLPSMTASVIEHPHRWLTLAAGWALLDQMSQQVAGEVEQDDLPKDMTSARQLGYVLPGMTQLPFKGAEGERFGIDLSRWTPFSALTGAPAPGSLSAAVSDRLPPLLQPTGPFVDLASRFGVNKDPYSGQDWMKPGDTGLQRTGKIAQAVAGFAGPSAISWHLPRMAIDALNQDPQALGVDALGLAGARPRTIREGQERARAEKNFENAARDISFQESVNMDKAENSPFMQRFYQRQAERGRENIDEHFLGRFERPARRRQAAPPPTKQPGSAMSRLREAAGSP